MTAIVRRVAATTVAGVLVVGCGGTSSTTVATEACPAPVEPPLQDGAHLLGDAEPPVPYSSVPPTSGWHASGNPRTGVIPPDAPLSDPELVLTIEVGQAVAAYDPGRLDDTELAELERLATEVHAGELTITPYVGADAPVSLVSWGVLQSCDEVDAEVIGAFVATHADPDDDVH